MTQLTEGDVRLGKKVVLMARPHPAGAKGARLSLKEVAEYAWKARMSPLLRAWATQVLDKAGVSRGGRRQKAQAILDAYRKRVPYISDPVMGEFMATPDQLLCLDKDGLCIIGADCFPEETLLLPEDLSAPNHIGNQVKIKDIKVGDRIWGRDDWCTILRKVDKGILAVDTISLDNGKHVPLTGDHHVYLESGLRVRVSELQPGAVLIRPKVIPARGPEPGKTEWSDSVRKASRCLVREIQRAHFRVSCWDITTSDGYVYLPEHDVTVSNCDEAAITLIAAMFCLGINAMAVGSSHKEPHDTPTHVFMAFQDELDDWVRMDGTTNHPVGHTAPHLREWWFEPGKEAKESGIGDFVGMSEKHVGVSASSDAFDFLYPGLRSR